MIEKIQNIYHLNKKTNSYYSATLSTRKLSEICAKP